MFHELQNELSRFILYLFWLIHPYIFSYLFFLHLNYLVHEFKYSSISFSYLIFSLNCFITTIWILSFIKINFLICFVWAYNFLKIVSFLIKIIDVSIFSLILFIIFFEWLWFNEQWVWFNVSKLAIFVQLRQTYNILFFGN